MLTETLTLQDLKLGYPIENIAPLEQVLFLDIETTGFTARSSSLYMIGCAYYENESFQFKQWMSENPSEEKELLESFWAFALTKKTLIHFNGNNFDLPYLLQKTKDYNLEYTFDVFEGIDLYKRLSPYKFFLKLPNCKQKTIEQFLGLPREDLYSGGELITVYHEYVKNPSEEAKNLLLTHNREDVIGMISLLPMLAYHDIFNGDIKAKKVQANHYTDHTGRTRQELFMTISLPNPLPRPISTSIMGCYFKGEEDTATLRVPVYEEELKYYYANYKDYYYLPTEDVALHKSVASFVDKEHRIKATASTCYTRKYSQYLPQWEVLFEPFFKRDYKSKELFFELTDELKTNRSAFTAYAKHVLEMMSTTY